MYAPDNRKKDNFFALAIGCLLCATLFIGGCAGCTKAGSNEDVTDTAGIQSTECGTCGAHVIEWWKVRNDANTTWVNVCERCIDAMEE